MSIASQNFNMLQKFTVLTNRLRVTNLRVCIFPKRDVKQPFLVYAVEAVKAGTVEEEKLCRIFYWVEILLIITVSDCKKEISASYGPI